MASQFAQYIFYAFGGAGAVVWAVITVQRWALSAKLRGGQWELEALLFMCGPIAATLVAFYPSDGSGPGILGNASRVVTDVAYALATIGIARGLRFRGRQATGLVVALLVYYFSLMVCGLGGVVPGIPEAYFLTPLVVMAFVLNGDCTLEWFLQMSRLTIRSIVILSLVSLFVVPDIAFNTDDARTVFGMNRLQGITSHPNTLGILAALGIVLEIKSKSRARILWILCMALGVILAQSSTAYVAVFAGAVLVTSRFSRLLRRLAIAVAAAGAVVVLTNADAAQSVSAFLTADEATKLLNGRTGIWDATLAGFYQNPLFGYGPSLLDDQYRQIYLPNFGAAAQAHNQWFQSLGEAGIFGVVAMISLLVGMVIYAFRARAATMGVSLALVAIFLVRAVTETPLRPAGLSVITFILLLVLCPSIYSPQQLTAIPDVPGFGQPKRSPRLAKAYRMPPRGLVPIARTTGS